MTTCDMCGDYRSVHQHYDIKLHGGELNRTLHTMDLCGKCRERVSQKISECLRDCRVSSVRDAVKGLTQEQVQQVEAYIAQLEVKREVPS